MRERGEGEREERGAGVELELGWNRRGSAGNCGELWGELCGDNGGALGELSDNCGGTKENGERLGNCGGTIGELLGNCGGTIGELWSTMWRIMVGSNPHPFLWCLIVAMTTTAGAKGRWGVGRGKGQRGVVWGDDAFIKYDSYVAFLILLYCSIHPGSRRTKTRKIAEWVSATIAVGSEAHAILRP